MVKGYNIRRLIISSIPDWIWSYLFRETERPVRSPGIDNLLRRYGGYRVFLYVPGT